MSSPRTAQGYAGELDVQQAWDRIAARPGQAVLVDVRTEQEWESVGRPVTTAAGAPTVFLPWSFADGQRNGAFLNELHPLKGKELLFICRSGNRSHYAALSAAAAGHTAYNVLGGFEGSGGWLAAGLPTDAE